MTIFYKFHTMQSVRFDFYFYLCLHRKHLFMILKYRMLSDENDNFVRDFEVLPEMTLAQFHAFIIASLGYDDCMASFFASDDRWNRLREYTLMDMGEDVLGGGEMPVPMDKVTLAELVVSDCKRLIYQFDMFSDRAFYLEFVDAHKPLAGLAYPRVAFENAPVPDQYDPDAVSADEGSIFEEMMGDFNDFEGDDSYDDEY